jgi:hypothetical protein
MDLLEQFLNRFPECWQVIKAKGKMEERSEQGVGALAQVEGLILAVAYLVDQLLYQTL